MSVVSTIEMFHIYFVAHSGHSLLPISMWALTRSQPRNNPYEITFLSDMELTTVKVRVILYINFSVTLKLLSHIIKASSTSHLALENKSIFILKQSFILNIA